MPAALSHEDCQKLYAQGLMTKDEVMECMWGFDRPMQETNPIDLAHMKLDSEWEAGNNPLYTSSLTGRDPPVPNVAGSGVDQVPSKMSLSGRAPSPSKLGIGEVGAIPLSALAVVALGLVGLYAGYRAVGGSARGRSSASEAE